MKNNINKHTNQFGVTINCQKKYRVKLIVARHSICSVFCSGSPFKCTNCQIKVIFFPSYVTHILINRPVRSSEPSGIISIPTISSDLCPFNYYEHVMSLSYRNKLNLLSIPITELFHSFHKFNWKSFHAWTALIAMILSFQMYKISVGKCLTYQPMDSSAPKRETNKTGKCKYREI